jgi:MoxR-like ATPase
VLVRRLSRRADDVVLNSVVGREELLAMQGSLENVYVSPAVGQYMVALVRSTRELTTVEIGASPRGSLALMLLSRARAALEGRDFVVPEDVKAVAVPALAHRLRLRPDLWVRGERPEAVISVCLGEVPVPSPEETTAPPAVGPSRT